MRFEFTILLDDIVMDAGEVQAANLQAAEAELQERYPDYNYMIQEAADDAR